MRNGDGIGDLMRGLGQTIEAEFERLDPLPFEARLDSLEDDRGNVEDRLDGLERASVSEESVAAAIESAMADIGNEHDVRQWAEEVAYGLVEPVTDGLAKLERCTREAFARTEAIDAEQDRQISELGGEVGALNRLNTDLAARVAELEAHLARVSSQLAAPVEGGAELDVMVKRRDERRWQVFGLTFAAGGERRNGRGG